MKHFLVLVFKSFLIVTLLILGSTLIASLLIWQYPQWIINTANAQRVLNYYNLNDRIRFQNFELNVSSISFLEKNIQIRLTDLCLDLQEPHRILFCAQDIELDTRLRFAGWRPRFVGQPLLRITGAELDLEIRHSSKPSPLTLPALTAPSYSAWLGFLKTWLPHDRWGSVAINLQRMDLRISPSLRVQGQTEVSSLVDPHRLSLTSSLRVQSPLQVRELPVNLHGTVDLREKKAELTVLAPEYQNLEADLSLARDLQIKIRGERKSTSGHIFLNSDLLWNEQLLDLKSRFDVRIDSLPIPSRRRKRPPQFEILHHLTARPQLNEQHWRILWEQNLEAPKLSGLELRVAAKGHINLRGQSERDAGKPIDWSQAIQLESFDGRLGTPQFAQLGKGLAWTTIQIPAPFYRMQGPFELKFKSENPNLEHAKINGHLRSRLADGMQVLNFDLNFDLQLQDIFGPKRHLQAQANLVLNKIILELPRLSPLSIPHFVMDSRLTGNKRKTGTKKENTPSPPSLTWDMDLKVSTPDEPILLHSNLISQPIPLKLNSNFQFQSGKDPRIQAQVQILHMNLELFRRTVQLEQIDLDRRVNGTTALNGLLLYRNSEVKVRILLLGTVAKPRIVLESDPPLSRQQLISIVIFGKSLGEMTLEETTSAQNLEQAFTDGALGLFSLIVLASTPIESISYNPVTQSYVARVKVGDNMSVALGSDFENRQSLAIRRQLWGAWSIKTELETEGVEKDHLSTFLEWFRRF